ncbi:unnamed protein product [Staurois parvus]|uniref:Uncharacterized protein n=1 Tax=Staurois parvus TaxID=386267 RepID=A0ABN9BLJ5_9NEOB|nr:unnamed protein product [Staurois parvus]
MYVHTRTYIHAHTYVNTCTHVRKYMHTQPYKKLHYFVVHSQIQVLHSRGRQIAQYTPLPLLSLRSAMEQSDSSQCQ